MVIPLVNGIQSDPQPLSDVKKVRAHLNGFVLEQWLQSNAHNMYPTRQQKEVLATEGHMSYNQVSRWFANRRRKLKVGRNGSPLGETEGENHSPLSSSDDSAPASQPSPRSPFDKLHQQKHPNAYQLDMIHAESDTCSKNGKLYVSTRQQIVNNMHHAGANYASPQQQHLPAFESLMRPQRHPFDSNAHLFSGSNTGLFPQFQLQPNPYLNTGFCPQFNPGPVMAPYCWDPSFGKFPFGAFGPQDAAFVQKDIAGQTGLNENRFVHQKTPEHWFVPKIEEELSIANESKNAAESKLSSANLQLFELTEEESIAVSVLAAFALQKKGKELKVDVQV